MRSTTHEGHMANTNLTRRPMWAALPNIAFPEEFGATRNRLRKLFDQPLMRMMDEPLFNDVLAEPVGWFPAVDVSETNDEYAFTAELPGMAREDVTIAWEDGVLTIKGEKTSEMKKDGKGDRKMHLWERTYGAFQRAFTFPATVSPEKIVAVMKDGVLKVSVPKTPEAKAASRKIEIKPA